MKKLFLLFVFLFPNMIALAQTSDVIILSPQKELLNIGRQVYLLEDKEGKLTIENIQKPEYQRLFKKSGAEIPNFNTNASKIWVKFTVVNKTQKEIYLEVAQALAWYIDFYKPNADGKLVLTTQTGMMRPMQNREVANNFFLFELSKQSETQTYYFSIRSEATLFIPLTLGTSKGLFEKSYPNVLFFGMFSGLMLIMFLYNLMVYFSVHDRIYLYYCGYLLTVLAVSDHLSGNYDYVWNVISYFSNYFFVFAFLANLFIVLFIFNLLHIQRKQTFFKVSVGTFCVLFLFVAVNLLSGHYILVSDAYQGCLLLYFLYVFFYSLSLYLKGNVIARFVVFGFSFHLLGVIVYIFQNFSLLPTNFFTMNAIVLGSAVEVMLFSLALGDRINTMRKDKEDALLAQQHTQLALLEKSQENEKLVKQQNILLEQKVNERTEELNQANEELNIMLDTVSKQRDDIISSINYAVRIQHAILPKETELQKYLDCFIFFEPKDIVSGDFYWFADKGNTKILAVADCTGHGVSGAFMTMIGNNILNQIVHSQEIHEPDQILNQMPIWLEKTLSHSEGKVKDGMDISILTLSKFETFTKVCYAGAMNPLYYVESQEFKEIKADKRPIDAKIDASIAYKKHEILIAHNSPSMFYMSSDGYQDQFGGEADTKFMVKNLRKMLFEISEKPTSEQKQITENAFQAWKGNKKQTDDVLVVGIRI